jgi:hypothetical protein
MSRHETWKTPEGVLVEVSWAESAEDFPDTARGGAGQCLVTLPTGEFTTQVIWDALPADWVLMGSTAKTGDGVHDWDASGALGLKEPPAEKAAAPKKAPTKKKKKK